MVDFKKKFLKKKSLTEGSDLRNKFKPRGEEVLQKAYEEKDKRSKFRGGGRTIFKMDLLEELNIDIFYPNTQKDGSYFFEIFPSSFNDNVPYFIEVPIHKSVGINYDNFVCLKRMAPEWLKNYNCYRCSKQKELYEIHNNKTTNEIKQLYPQDSVVYLGWNRTEEFGADKEPTFRLSLWIPPKIVVHGEIQKQVRDKKSHKILDISDINQGRTIYFDIELKESVDNHTGQKRKFPQYGGFDLIEREDPIPDNMLDLLDRAITKMESLMVPGMKNPLEVLLNIHDDDELKAAMGSEIHEGDEKKETKFEKKMTKLEQIRAKRAAKNDKSGIDLEEIEKTLSQMDRDEIIEWAIDHSFEDCLDEEMDRDTMQEALMEYFTKKLKDEEDLPF